MQQYVADHQDRSRNAMVKASKAAFNSWCEDLKADQAQFMSEKLLCLGCELYRKRCSECCMGVKICCCKYITKALSDYFFCDQWQMFQKIDSTKGRKRICESTHKVDPAVGGPISLLSTLYKHWQLLTSRPLGYSNYVKQPS